MQADAKQGLLSIVLIFIHMSKNPLVKTDKVKVNKSIKSLL